MTKKLSISFLMSLFYVDDHELEHLNLGWFVFRAWFLLLQGYNGHFICRWDILLASSASYNSIIMHYLLVSVYPPRFKYLLSVGSDGSRLPNSYQDMDCLCYVLLMVHLLLTSTKIINLMEMQFL